MRIHTSETLATPDTERVLWALERSLHDVSVEVVDLRTIRPLDIDTVLKSVAKTHRVLIVEEQKPFASVGSQLAFMIQKEAFDDLDAPIGRLATVDAPAIYSPPVEAEQLPNPQRIIKAAIAVLE